MFNVYEIICFLCVLIVCYFNVNYYMVYVILIRCYIGKLINISMVNIMIMYCVVVLLIFVDY